MSAGAGLAEIIAAHLGREGPLLPILHAVQHAFGCVDAAAEVEIAKALNLTRAEVHGVVSFYPDFRAEADPRPEVQLCRAEACQSVGAEALAAHARTALGVGFGETTDDGRVTLDEVFCLGNCALGPSVQVDGALRGRVTPGRLDAILGDL